MIRTLLMLLAFALPLRAHNNLFLPGDAFFTAMVTIDEVEKWRPGPVTLEYSRLLGIGYLCGYFGYGKATIVDVNQSTIDGVLSTLRKLEKEGRGYREGEAADGKKIRWFRIFLYQRDCNLESLRIGLRYNENWATIQRAHASEEHVLYDEIGGAGAIIENWQSCELVRGLTYTATKAVSEGEGRESLEISLKAADIKFVVCANVDIRSYVDLSEDLVWHEVTDGVTVRVRPRPKTDP
jgi:hypothetical protein